MLNNLENLVLYAGIDESNHGHDNEIYAAVFSCKSKDIILGNYKKSTDAAKSKEEKRHRTEKAVESVKKDYSFLILQNELKKQIPPSKLIGIIISSLLQDINPEEFEKINLYLDGEWKSQEKIYIKERTAEILDTEKNKIIVESGAKYDQKIRIVNLADHLAHYLFRYKTLEELEENKNLKKIIF